MNNLQIFESEEFGAVRTVTVENEPFFCLVDICKALEISNVSQAKTRLNQDGVISNEVIDSIGRTQTANFVNESNMYKLIFQSRKKSAERFTEWVTSECFRRSAEPAVTRCRHRREKSFLRWRCWKHRRRLMSRARQSNE